MIGGVQDGAPVKVLLITGTVGAGKTSLAREVGELLRTGAVTSAVIDLDALSHVSPGEGGDRFNSRFVVRNLEALWPNYEALGVGHLVLARFIASGEELARYREAVPRAAFTVCRVTAPPEIVRRRLRERERGVARQFLLDLSGTLEEEIDTAGVEDFTVHNGDGRSITDLAREVLARAGWPLPHR